MAEFVPVNPLEIALLQLLRDKHTPVWSFYTPLGASPVWFFAQHYPELDGSDLAAPEGENPNLCVFRGPEDALLSLYTTGHRAKEVFAKMKLHPGTFAVVSALGFEVLRLFRAVEPDARLLVNLWAEGQYHLDDDLVDLLLSRPAPPPLAEHPKEMVDFTVVGEPERYLEPLRKFLAGQANVRGAWIAMAEREVSAPPGTTSYLLQLLMRDPEDDSLLEKVGTMAKALTPVEMEWTSAIIAADDNSLRHLARLHRPFYSATDFTR